MALRTLGPRVAPVRTWAVRPPPKTVDPFYLSPEYQAWRAAVVQRAGARCEAIDRLTGLRCTKAAPAHRMFADHIKERRDGGDPLDTANGRCLCGSHHTAKTATERAKRRG